MSELPWYKDGLRFECTGCGGCCTGSPGYVWVSDEEIEKMATYLNLSLEEFSKNYLRLIGKRYSLREHPRAGNYDCFFLKEKRCTIYPVRPSQCSAFPWWRENLDSPESWTETARRCEGINKTAPLVSLLDIENKKI
jgi:Fe-S-cluster containining protein